MSMRVKLSKASKLIRGAAEESSQVASGEGRPENGGVLLLVPGEGLFSMKLLIRRLMGTQYDKVTVVWTLWELWARHNHPRIVR
jgi:hypothetical protein